MTQTRWLNDLELSAWKNLSLMQLQLTARLNRQLVDAGLSYPDYLVLATLGDQPDGRRRVVELASEVGWEKSRASHHISRMCERGLVEKEKCPTDQRGAYVVLTDEGRRLAAQVAPQHVADVRALFIDQSSPDELAVINSVSARVLAHLAEERRG